MGLQKLWLNGINVWDKISFMQITFRIMHYKNKCNLNFLGGSNDDGESIRKRTSTENGKKENIFFSV